MTLRSSSINSHLPIHILNNYSPSIIYLSEYLSLHPSPLPSLPPPSIYQFFYRVKSFHLTILLLAHRWPMHTLICHSFIHVPDPFSSSSMTKPPRISLLGIDIFFHSHPLDSTHSKHMPITFTHALTLSLTLSRAASLNLPSTARVSEKGRKQWREEREREGEREREREREGTASTIRHTERMREIKADWGRKRKRARKWDIVRQIEGGTEREGWRENLYLFLCLALFSIAIRHCYGSSVMRSMAHLWSHLRALSWHLISNNGLAALANTQLQLTNYKPPTKPKRQPFYIWNSYILYFPRVANLFILILPVKAEKGTIKRRRSNKCFRGFNNGWLHFYRTQHHCHQTDGWITTIYAGVTPLYLQHTPHNLHSRGPYTLLHTKQLCMNHILSWCYLLLLFALGMIGFQFEFQKCPCLHTFEGKINESPFFGFWWKTNFIVPSIFVHYGEL